MLFITVTMMLTSIFNLLAVTPSACSAARPATKFPILPRMANQSKIFDYILANHLQKYFAHASCTPKQKIIERATWRDALQLARALASWQPNGTFQPAMDLYMGNNSRGYLSKELRGMANGILNLSPADREHCS